MARRNKPAPPSKHHTETIPKAVRTFQGSRQSISSRLQNRTTKTLENPQRFPCIPTHTVQRNQSARTQLLGTSTRHPRRRTRMGGRKSPPNKTLWAQQKETIPSQMERILTLTRLMGRRVRHERSRPSPRILQESSRSNKGQ